MPNSKNSTKIHRVDDTSVQHHHDAELGAHRIDFNDRGNSFARCCVPKGCSNELIRVDEPGDSVRVYCNNESCTESGWMHAPCFQEWEQHVLAYLRSCGRARSWSEKQRLQNLWTKKGYDLAFKACDCKCGRGHLRKDLNYIAPKPSPTIDKKQRKTNRKKSGDKTMMQVPKNPPSSVPIHGMSMASAIVGVPHHQNRPQLRVRTSSISSTGSSPPSSAGTPPLTPGGKPKMEFFADLGQAAAGNIFRRRTDFSVFNILPRHQQNPYHIKMEDEGPHGNDETRCFILTNLSTHQITEMHCAVCQLELPVFDKYPLIDGTFFLSPMRYNQDLQVVFDHRPMFLNAVCMRCLEGCRGPMKCRACKTPWKGNTLIIGTMYSYDIFAAVPCCGQRLTCKNCSRAILDPSCALPFSGYSKAIQCPHCQAQDYHFIKPLPNVFTCKGAGTVGLRR